MKKIIFGTLLLIPLVIVGLAWFAGSSLTAPVNRPVGSCPDDLVCEQVEFASGSGGVIKGWFLPGEKGKGAVVLMHGLRASRLDLVDRIRFLRRAGYSVLAFDFQGSGESPGDRLTFGYLESRDAEAALGFIGGKLPGEKIGVVGISMGGAAFLLARDKSEVGALILEMVYPTIRKAVENRLNLWLFNGAGNFSFLLTQQFPLRLGVSADQLRPLDRIKDVRAPVLIIAGENDRHTTLEESKQLFDAASEPKEMWIVPQAEHADLFKVAPAEYERRVLGFFEKNLR